jgi:uncharacterized membrane protein YbhN (UPF0104 family)
MIARILDLLRYLRRGPSNPRAQRGLVALGVFLFGAITFAGVSNLPAGTQIDLSYLTLLAIVGGPAISLATATEYRAVASLSDLDSPWRDSLIVTTAAAIANLLPIPGSTLVRAAHLRRLGASSIEIARAVSASGFAFVGVTAVVAAAATASTGIWTACAFFGCMGVGSLTASFFSVRADTGRANKYFRLLLAECLVVATVVSRLYVALGVIGQDQSVFAASLLGTASVGAAAIAILPGGLGVREALSGLLGSAAGLDLSTGIVAASLDRLTYYAGVAVAALLLLATGRLHGMLSSVGAVDGRTERL